MSEVSTRQAVDALLEQYRQYLAYQSEVDALERQLAKQKLRGESTEAASQLLDERRAAISQLSDAMTFATPLIWVMYKHEAYQHEAQPIRTMHDLRLHCAKPGYICTKRMQFLNAYLTSRGRVPLSDDEQYPDALSLDMIYETLSQLEEDTTLLEQWRHHEYFTEDGVVKKWQNYIDKNS